MKSIECLDIFIVISFQCSFHKVLQSSSQQIPQSVELLPRLGIFDGYKTLKNNSLSLHFPDCRFTLLSLINRVLLQTHLSALCLSLDEEHIMFLKMEQFHINAEIANLLRKCAIRAYCGLVQLYMHMHRLRTFFTF